jgi:hypothetical protein
MFNFFDRRNKGYVNNAKKSGGIFDFFGQKKKGYENNNNINAELKKQIQEKYKQNGVTDEYLFEYFKHRKPDDQINLNRFMNKYIPLSMRKKKKVKPLSVGPTCFNKINKIKINKVQVKQSYNLQKNNPNYNKLYKNFTGHNKCSNQNVSNFKEFVGIPYSNKKPNTSNLLAKIQELKSQI